MLSDPHQLWVDDNNRSHADGANGDDRTLCGDDLMQADGSQKAMTSFVGKIDCPHCLGIIRHARAIPRRFIPKEHVSTKEQR